MKANIIEPLLLRKDANFTARVARIVRRSILRCRSAASWMVTREFLV